MRSTNARRAVAACLLVLSLSARGVASPQTPELTDAAGDANYVNNQKFLPVPIPDDGPDTRPASLDGADIVAGWYETGFKTETVLDPSGNVLDVNHVPDALILHLRTSAPPVPSFGPTVNYDLWVNVGACSMILRFYARGPASQADDPLQRAELRTRKADCIEGPKTYSEGITLAFDGNVTTLRYPFENLKLGKFSLIKDGSIIEPDADGNLFDVSTSHRLPTGALFGGQPIDLASAPAVFQVGSDVPPDIDCQVTPDDPACDP